MWEIVNGKIPVLLVAGHNAPHLRNGQIKKRDWGTGNMVKFLSEKTGAWGIVTTEVQVDPNFHEEAELRQEVIKLISDQAIELVLDIHGRRADYPYLVEFFVNKYFDQNLLTGEMVFNAWTKSQKLLVNALSVPAVEVEIRRDGRIWETESFKNVVEKLEKIIVTPPSPTEPHPFIPSPQSRRGGKRIKKFLHFGRNDPSPGSEQAGENRVTLNQVKSPD